MKDVNRHGRLKARLVRWLFGTPTRGMQATRLRPGDTLVLRLGYPVSAEGMARAYEHVHRAVPDGVKVLVIEPNAEVQVLSGGGDESQAATEYRLATPEERRRWGIDVGGSRS